MCTCSDAVRVLCRVFVFICGRAVSPGGHNVCLFREHLSAAEIATTLSLRLLSLSLSLTLSRRCRLFPFLSLATLRIFLYFFPSFSSCLCRISIPDLLPLSIYVSLIVSLSPILATNEIVVNVALGTASFDSRETRR